MPINKILAAIIATTVAVGFGIVTAQVALPALTTGLGTPTLDTINGLGASDLISWFVFLMTFGMAALILLVFTMYANPLAGYRRQVGIALLCCLLVIPEICIISWGYVLIVRPDVLMSTPLITKFLNFLSFPSLLIAIVGDPQGVWLLSALLFAIQFLFTFLLKTRQ